MMILQFIIDLILLSLYAFLTVTIFVYIRRFWVMHVNQKHVNKLQDDTILLEIKLPREIDKSPLAMEFVLLNLTQGGGLSWYGRGIQGTIPISFSLEIASLEGVIHFYIRGHKKFKELISSALYAQYPGIEVVVSPDYTASFPRYEHNKKDVSMWGNSFKLTKDFTIEKKDKKREKTFFEKYVFFDDDNDIPKSEKEEDKDKKLPADIYPIQTYIDLGLDKQKEEMKIDPLVNMLEFLGSLGKGEFAGFQILIEDPGVHNGTKSYALWHHPITHKNITSPSALATLYKDFLRNKKEMKAGAEVIDQYGNKIIKKQGEDGKDPIYLTYGQDFSTQTQESLLTYEVKNAIELVERKMAKPLFACMMRVLYVSDNKKSKFNANYIQNCLGLMRPFSFPGFNTFSGFINLSNPYDFDWEDPKKIRGNWRAEEVFDAYIEREGFHPHIGLIDWFSGPEADSMFTKYKGYIRRTITIVSEALLDPFGHPHPEDIFILNTEELATIFHLPGAVASVPTLPRIDSRKAVAPVNLPV